MLGMVSLCRFHQAFPRVMGVVCKALKANRDGLELGNSIAWLHALTSV